MMDPISLPEAGSGGAIFNIQRYSIHDGPGIRTTVFLKKCHLACVWCQNPESQSEQAEVFFDAGRCAGCGRCATVCPQSAIRIHDGRSWTDRSRCKGSGDCASACPNDARSLVGRRASAEEIFRETAEDAIFYADSGGGVTLSGGDPLAQPGFSIEILRLCKEAGFHVTLDTCGHGSWGTVREIMRYVDLVLFDFKHMDPAKHEEYTGASNELILENAWRIHHGLRIPMRARYAVIPGYNDSCANAEATADFIAQKLDRTIPVDLLPYHRYGCGKYQSLERIDPLADAVPPAEAHLAELKSIFESRGLVAQIGG